LGGGQLIKTALAVPASLASGREFGRRSPPREASGGFIIRLPLFTSGSPGPDRCPVTDGEPAAGQQPGPPPLCDIITVAAGGGQLMALAAAAVRLSAPAATAAVTAAPAAARRMRAFDMAWSSRFCRRLASLWPAPLE
jgi:hypothetical protein